MAPAGASSTTVMATRTLGGVLLVLLSLALNATDAFVVPAAGRCHRSMFYFVLFSMMGRARCCAYVALLDSAIGAMTVVISLL